jgi:hypothetical protein
MSPDLRPLVTWHAKQALLSLLTGDTGTVRRRVYLIRRLIRIDRILQARRG